MTTAQKIEDTLERAAQLIEKDGWCRYGFYVAGKHCVSGAARDVTSTIIDWTHATLAMDIEAARRGITSGAVDWNDTVCRGPKRAAQFIRASKKHVARLFAE